MNNRLTPTLALVIAGGLAAGIALARPGSPTDPTAVATADAATPAPRGGGYLGGSEPAAEATPDAAAAPAAAAPASITIRDFAFAGDATVAPGQPITVTNEDGASHTLTAESGAFDTGNLVEGAAVAIAAPDAAGTYSYFCAIHPSMQGSLTVG